MKYKAFPWTIVRKVQQFKELPPTLSWAHILLTYMAFLLFRKWHILHQQTWRVGITKNLNSTYFKTLRKYPCNTRHLFQATLVTVIFVFLHTFWVKLHHKQHSWQTPLFDVISYQIKLLSDCTNWHHHREGHP